MMRSPIHIACLTASLAAGCGAELGSDELEAKSNEPAANWERDLLDTRLEIDLATRKATALIAVDKHSRRGLSLDVSGLTLDSVESSSVDGTLRPVAHRIVDGQLELALPASRAVELRIRYGFSVQSKLEGLTKGGATFTWPHFCGNLFPCQPDPADGLTFELALQNVPAGKRAVHPKSIPNDAPPYMLAWAVGDYTRLELGTTAQGRHVSVDYLPGEKTAATSGTKDLARVFEWLETTYGEYLFGDEVGSVSASWGQGAFGGMEHHPFWHVSHDSMGDAETHAHEAAHGWFGDGVRLRCWEDLTLSEGTVSYLTARALEATNGKAAGDAVWKDYEARLDAVIASEDRLAWPTGCNEIDVLKDLWNEVVYMKGAFFYRAVESEVGRAPLDQAIRAFYGDYKGEAAGVSDMLDTLRESTGFDASALAKGWLQQLGRPDR
ncbi:MAG: peptidase M1 [Myxococcales bacterium]|nr:peptidase M1 [Myxococcales bacterium]